MVTRALALFTIWTCLGVGGVAHGDGEITMLPVPADWHETFIADNFASRFQAVSLPALASDGDWLAASCITEVMGTDAELELRRHVVMYQHLGGQWNYRQTLSDIAPIVGADRSLTGLTDRSKGTMSPAPSLDIDGDLMVVVAQELDWCPARTYRLINGTWTLESSFDTGHDPGTNTMKPRVVLSDGLLCVATYQRDLANGGKRDRVRLYRMDEAKQWAQTNEFMSPQYPMTSFFGAGMDLDDSVLVIGGGAVLEGPVPGLLQLRDRHHPEFPILASVYPQGMEGLFLGNRCLQLSNGKLFALTPDSTGIGRTVLLHVLEPNEDGHWIPSSRLCLDEIIKNLPGEEFDKCMLDLSVHGDSVAVALSRANTADPFGLIRLQYSDVGLTLESATSFDPADAPPGWDQVRLYRGIAHHGDDVIAFVIATEGNKIRPALVTLSPK